ncbi:MAG: PH domain-containing protein [Candidatus Eremiobacteraeota bacterium]|nr:PH domain-containing protein [Candidatus Eremiobacteraeota bacterium]
MEGKVFSMVPGSQTPVIVFWSLTVLVAVITVLMASMALSMNRVSFVLSAEGLRIRSALYGRFIPSRAIMKDKAEIITLSKDNPLNPSWRSNGIGLPGFAAGWFRLKNKEKALLFLTTSSNIVYIPTSEGFSVMLSVQDAGEFLRVLKQQEVNL